MEVWGWGLGQSSRVGVWGGEQGVRQGPRIHLTSAQRGGGQAALAARLGGSPQGQQLRQRPLGLPLFGAPLELGALHRPVLLALWGGGHGPSDPRCPVRPPLSLHPAEPRVGRGRPPVGAGGAALPGPPLTVQGQLLLQGPPVLGAAEQRLPVTAEGGREGSAKSSPPPAPQNHPPPPQNHPLLTRWGCGGSAPPATSLPGGTLAA